MHMPIAAVAYTMAITSLCISSLGGLVKSLIRLHFSCLLGDRQYIAKGGNCHVAGCIFGRHELLERGLEPQASPPGHGWATASCGGRRDGKQDATTRQTLW
jgi:hypothetical protein